MTPAPFRYSLAPFIAFRDLNACARVRAIRRADIARHANPVFRIEVIETPLEFFSRFAVDIVSRISRTRDEGRRCVLILPVGPVPQYAIAADMINRQRIDCRHLVTFNMDEYADDQGRTAPAGWEGSFATSMRQSFFEKLDPKLLEELAKKRHRADEIQKLEALLQRGTITPAQFEAQKQKLLGG